MKSLNVQFKNHFSPCCGREWIFSSFLQGSNMAHWSNLNAQLSLAPSNPERMFQLWSYFIITSDRSSLMSLLLSYKSINQTYFSSLINIKTRKIWNKEIISNSNIAHVTMPLAFSQLPKHLVRLSVIKASEQVFSFIWRKQRCFVIYISLTVLSKNR